MCMWFLFYMLIVVVLPIYMLLIRLVLFSLPGRILAHVGDVEDMILDDLGLRMPSEWVI